MLPECGGQAGRKYVAESRQCPACRSPQGFSATRTSDSSIVPTACSSRLQGALSPASNRPARTATGTPSAAELRPGATALPGLRENRTGAAANPSESSRDAVAPLGDPLATYPRRVPGTYRKFVPPLLRRLRRPAHHLPHATRRVAVEGSVFVLYSDDLVESRDDGIAVGAQCLGAATAQSGASSHQEQRTSPVAVRAETSAHAPPRHRHSRRPSAHTRFSAPSALGHDARGPLLRAKHGVSLQPPSLATTMMSRDVRQSELV